MRRPRTWSRMCSSGLDLTSHWTITDGAGQTATWSMSVRVYPAVTPAITVPRLGPGRYRYQATATGGDGVALACQWRFSDGTVAAGPVVTHTFARGVAAARLSVTDGTGSVGTGTG